MAGVSLRITSTSCGDALGIIAPGESAKIGVALENSNAKTVTRVRLWLECLIGSTYYQVSGAEVITDPIDKGYGIATTRSFTALAASQGVYAALRSQGLRGKKGLYLAGAYTLKGSSTETSLTRAAVSALGVCDRRCRPTAGLPSGSNVQLCKRALSSGAVSDEGTYALLSLKLGLSDQTWVNAMRCVFHYGSNSTLDLTGSRAALLNGVTDSTLLISAGLQFSNASDWPVYVTFGDDYEQARLSGTVFRAFSNMHLSAARNGGVAFGGFSSATDASPKLESRYPCYFYGGVPVLAVTWVNVAVNGGVITPNDNNYGDGALRVAKIGSHVFVRGGIYANSKTNVATLPAGYRPTVGSVYRLAACGGARVARLRLTTAGLLELEWVRNLSDGAEYSTAVWVDCSFDFWT